MNKKVKISDIVTSIEAQSAETFAYLNLLTYEINFTVSKLNKSTSWTRDLKTAEDLEFDNDYLFLPTLHDFHEHQVMVDFSRTTSPEIAERLLSVLFKKGAFKNFRKMLERFFLVDKWHRYKDEKLRELAINWCKKNKLNYEE